MPLSKATLKSALISGPYASSCPTSSTEAASGWVAAMSTYFQSMASPPVGSGVATAAAPVSATLAEAMTTSTDAGTTFAPIDGLISSISALAASTSVGAATYSGTFGDYAFDGVIDEDTASEAADKVADNIHSHITDISNCTFTPPSGTATVWS